jgi:7,8-dihydropterin-6-yl-methyl-4-(beta-D-ribofuranosyl)aminobenzene 5'-phosphate synthase
LVCISIKRKTRIAQKKEEIKTMKIKITTLIENNPDDLGQLLFEHGLSLYIEADGKKILFDTGQSGDFIENANSLDKSLEALDFCIISHGHYDHSGGIERFVSESCKKPVFFVGEEFFRPKYKRADVSDYKYIGNSIEEDFFVKNQISLKKVKEDMVYLTDRILLFHHFSEYTDYEKRNDKFYVKGRKDYIPDDFADEISMGIISEKGLVVIVGCSHFGIVNILKTIAHKVALPIYAVIGGTHLIDAGEDRMQKTIDAFCEMNIQLLAVSHCTGENGICLMKEKMEGPFFYNNTGKVIEI